MKQALRPVFLAGLTLLVVALGAVVAALACLRMGTSAACQGAATGAVLALAVGLVSQAVAWWKLRSPARRQPATQGVLLELLSGILVGSVALGFGLF